MIRLSQSEQQVWDAYYVSVIPQIILQAPQRGPEYIAERAAEIADEMLGERRERSAVQLPPVLGAIRPTQ